MVSKSMNKIHHTWEQKFSPPLYLSREFRHLTLSDREVRVHTTLSLQAHLSSAISAFSDDPAPSDNEIHRVISNLSII